jgi:hypothetical protein
MLEYKSQPQDFIRGGSRQSDQLRNQLVEWAHDIDPSYDSKQFGARSQAAKAFGSGVQAQNLTSLNTAERHLQTIEDAAKNLPGHGGLPGATTVNAVENWFSKSAGKKTVTDFESVRSKLAREIDRAFTGAGALAQEGIKRELDALNPAMSTEQLTSGIKRIREMLAGRREELASSYERIMGRPLTADVIRTAPPARKTVGGVTYEKNPSDGKWYPKQ